MKSWMEHSKASLSPSDHFSHDLLGALKDTAALEMAIARSASTSSAALLSLPEHVSTVWSQLVSCVALNEKQIVSNTHVTGTRFSAFFEPCVTENTSSVLLHRKTIRKRPVAPEYLGLDCGDMTPHRLAAWGSATVGMARPTPSAPWSVFGFSWATLTNTFLREYECTQRNQADVVTPYTSSLWSKWSQD